MAAKYAELDPLPTLQQLEAQHGLHRDTINRILGKLEGEGLIIRNGRRRYPVHRHRSEDRMIALEHVYHRNDHPFFGPLNDGLVDTFLSNEYGVHLFTHRDPQKNKLNSGAIMSTLLERGILRGIVLSINTPSLSDIQAFRNHDVAICMIGVEPGPGVIVFDLEQAALQGTHYLAKCGFDQIGIVTSWSITKSMDLRGYSQALALNDLPYLAENIIDCTEFLHDAVEDYTSHDIQFEVFLRERLKPIIDGTKQLVINRIKAGTFPRALYISDEFLAIGTMRALQEMGLRVPEDVAIVSQMSYGNTAAELIGLTTVQFNGYLCGKEAAQFMIDIAQGQRPADDRLTLRAELVAGMSCGELDENDRNILNHGFTQRV